MCCVFVVACGSFGVVCYELLLLFVVRLSVGGWVLIVLCVRRSWFAFCWFIVYLFG